MQPETVMHPDMVNHADLANQMPPATEAPVTRREFETLSAMVSNIVNDLAMIADSGAVLTPDDRKTLDHAAHVLVKYHATDKPKQRG